MRLTAIYPGENSITINTTSNSLRWALDELYNTLQVVKGTELPVKMNLRSMMVGDLVHKKDENRWFLCGVVGWKEITPDFAREWKFLPRRVRVMGYDYVKEKELIRVKCLLKNRG